VDDVVPIHVKNELDKISRLYLDGKINYYTLRRVAGLTERSVGDVVPIHVKNELDKISRLYLDGKINYDTLRRVVGLTERYLVLSTSTASFDFVAEILSMQLDEETLNVIYELVKTSKKPHAHTFYHEFSKYRGNTIYSRQSFSQEGEDLVLRKILNVNEIGFYVDVGAYRPVEYSNTYYFYASGWRGINIEPNPDAREAFANERKNDVNVSCAVGVGAESLTYYVYKEAAYNTFSKARTEELMSSFGKQPISTITDIPIRSLGSILEEHEVSEISFMNIDVEGGELGILESNDWSKYTPTLVLVEQHERELTKISCSDVYNYLIAHGYELIVMTYSTCFYKRVGS
jgi:FkbM family methyltransferase